MKYHGAASRRLRQLRRFGSSLLRPQVWGAPIVPAFWWDGHPNFGDDMTPWLLPRYGLVPLYREPRDAQLVGVGSLLEFLPEDFSGSIWGTGLIRPESRSLPRARVLAVRGPFTADLIGATGVRAFGDPGILVARHLPRPARRHRIGVVPHGHHRSHPGLAGAIASAGDGIHIVDVHQSAASAAREIASCEAIVTTSLHGLITADAYGIPAVWTTLEPPLDGGDFKFRDYEAALTPGISRYREFIEGTTLERMLAGVEAVDADAVEAMSSGLEIALRSAASARGDLPRFPLGVPGSLRG